MNAKSKSKFTFPDVLLILLMLAPIVGAIALKVLLVPQEEGIAIHGAFIYTTLDLGFTTLPITETQVNSWAVIVAVFWLCIFLTRNLTERCETVRQHVAEWIVEKVEKLVVDNMGEYFRNFAPFIAAILGLSAFSSLLSLTGLYPPTSDLNVTAGWAILTFVLITYYKMKCGPIYYLKTLCSPVLLTPLNLIGEVATPVSMAFRHYGNVLSGTVISTLIAALLQTVSQFVLGWLPGVVGQIPLFRIGLPAVLSVYFDVFSGCLQAFIFAMLTMLYVSGGFPLEEYMARKQLKLERKQKKAKKKEQKKEALSC